MNKTDVSEVATVAKLGAAHTLLAIALSAPGADRFYTVAEVTNYWAGGTELEPNRLSDTVSKRNWAQSWRTACE